MTVRPMARRGYQHGRGYSKSDARLVGEDEAIDKVTGEAEGKALAMVARRVWHGWLHR